MGKLTIGLAALLGAAAFGLAGQTATPPAKVRVRPPPPPYQVPEGAPKGPFAGYKPDTPGVDVTVQKAKQIAGNEYAFLWDRYCNPIDRWGRNRARGVSEAGTGDLGLDFSYMPPLKMFDNLYYVGLTEVAAYAIKTSAGYILIDTLNSTTDAKDTIVKGFRTLGLDPSQIKYIIIMHGHADHYGGAGYLQDRYKARVVMSAVDWDLVAKQTAKPDVPLPRRDIAVVNGDVVKLGNTTVKLYLTPGHTPGTLAATFDVYDHGVPHHLVFWGGSSFPTDKPGITDYMQSAARIRGIADATGADVVIGNHPQLENTTRRLREMIADPGPPNPLVIGRDSVNAFIDTFYLCAFAARQRLAHEQ